MKELNLPKNATWDEALSKSRLKKMEIQAKISAKIPEKISSKTSFVDMKLNQKKLSDYLRNKENLCWAKKFSDDSRLNPKKLLDYLNNQISKFSKIKDADPRQIKKELPKFL